MGEEEVPYLVEEPPNILYRACLNCRIVKSFAEFLQGGCPNCEKYMKFKFNMERVIHCSTITFNELHVLPEGYDKWCPRLKPVGTFVFGIYAFNVIGIIPFRFMFELCSEENGADIGTRCV